MEKDIEDKLSTPNSWIPLKAIKKIMGINDSPKAAEKSRASLNTPEDAPNKSINSSNFFVKLHNNYALPPNSALTKTSSQVMLRLNEKEHYIKSLENKLRASESETLLLKTKLKVAKQEISDLHKLISVIRTEHMIKLQNVQEKHEKRLYKTKQDLDFLLKEMNHRSNMLILDDFIKLHLAEMERCRENYEGIIDTYLKRLGKQESRGNKDFIADVSKKLEVRLDAELSDLKQKYVDQIERLKGLVTHGSFEGFDEDELSTGLNSERTGSEHYIKY